MRNDKSNRFLRLESSQSAMEYGKTGGKLKGGRTRRMRLPCPMRVTVKEKEKKDTENFRGRRQKIIRPGASGTNRKIEIQGDL